MDTVQPVEGHYLVAPLVPEFLAWVEVDGEPAKVYGAEVTENKAVGYIEAKEGQQFKVCYLDNRAGPSTPEDAYAMRLRIDGTNTAGHLTRSDDSSFSEGAYSKARISTFSGRQVSESSEQPFLFSKLLTTDSEDLACNDEKIVKNLGALQLRYWRVTNLRPASVVVYNDSKAILIHEQAKKAQLSHQANFGEAVPIEPVSRTNCDFIDSRESPFFLIDFRYRSRQLLQLDDYIPHSPAPSPEPSPSPSPSLSVSPAPAQAQSLDSPVASTSTSNPNPSGSSAQPSQSSQSHNPEPGRLARLQAELESLLRQERIAALRSEIAGLEGEVGGIGGAGSSSWNRKVKAEPSDDQRDAKKVKREIDAATFSASKSNGKGKGKKKAEVIELSDSD